jgi:signal peptidase I
VAKRIVGLPGEKISMRDNHIFINGAELEKPEAVRALKYYAIGSLAASRAVDCGNGYFVLGDDSRNSYDSRYTGPVAAESFRGRAWCILWPFSHAGFVR